MVRVERVEVALEAVAFVDVRDDSGEALTYAFQRSEPTPKHPAVHVRLVEVTEAGRVVVHRVLGRSAATRAARRALLHDSLPRRPRPS